MEQNAFELIAGKIAEELGPQGFNLVQSGKVESDKPSIFANETTAYAVIYDRKQKRFELRQAAVEDGAIGEEWKSLSLWMFDPENDTMREAESIANDFLDTLGAAARKRVVAEKKKKREKGEDRTVDPTFFVNRMVTLFPDLKYALQVHKTHYGDLLPVHFVEQAVMPEISALLASGDAARQEKLFEQLSSSYKNGDLDVKSIITMVILNHIDESAVAKAEELGSEELLRAWKFGRRMKGKKVKPEKVKRMEKLMAENSSDRLKPPKKI